MSLHYLVKLEMLIGHSIIYYTSTGAPKFARFELFTSYVTLH